MYNNTVQYYKIEEPPLLFATQMGGQTSVINLHVGCVAHYKKKVFQNRVSHSLTCSREVYTT